MLPPSSEIVNVTDKCMAELVSLALPSRLTLTSAHFLIQCMHLQVSVGRGYLSA